MIHVVDTTGARRSVHPTRAGPNFSTLEFVTAAKLHCYEDTLKKSNYNKLNVRQGSS